MHYQLLGSFSISQSCLNRWALYPPGRVPAGVTVHVNEEDGDVNIETPSSLQVFYWKTFKIASSLVSSDSFSLGFCALFHRILSQIFLLLVFSGGLIFIHF